MLFLRTDRYSRPVEYLVITLAAFIYGLGTSLFSDPNHLAPGGVTGIAIVLNRVAGHGVGFWFLVCNIPILILAVWKFGLRFTVSTLYATLMISVFTDLIARKLSFLAVADDYVLGSVFGSVQMGAAMGMIFLCHATSGGTDVIIKLLRIRFPHLRTGMLFFLTDIVIVLAAGIVFEDVRCALYSFLATIVTSLVMDFVLYGRDEAKLIYIISDRIEEISERLLKESDVGVTHIFSEGAYSREEKKVILCAIKKRMYPMAEEIVRQEDPEAFLIVTSASEIFGEGYKSYFEERM